MAQYKRNQVDLALWYLFVSPGTRPEISPVFKTRIKRLLDLDRRPPEPDSADSIYQDWPDSPAFSSDQVHWGKGAVATFTLFDAFCLLLGLDLLDMGFKQAEVVFLLRHIRPELDDVFQTIAGKLPSTFSFQRDIPEEDQVFLLLRKIELKEPYPALGAAQQGKPIFTVPKYCSGTKELHEMLADTTSRYRKTLVMELAKPAALLNAYLNDVQPAHRGRG